MDRVKLQIVLKEPLSDEAYRPLAMQLEKCGLEITGHGVMTVTATISPERYREMFGKTPNARSGFAAGIGDVLAVPEALASYVESITDTPRHIPLSGA